MNSLLVLGFGWQEGRVRMSIMVIREWGFMGELKVLPKDREVGM